MNRWAKSGVLERVFASVQREQLGRIRLEAVSLDSTSVKVHPDGTGAEKKTARTRCGVMRCAPAPGVWGDQERRRFRESRPGQVYGPGRLSPPESPIRF